MFSDAFYKELAKLVTRYEKKKCVDKHGQSKETKTAA